MEVVWKDVVGFEGLYKISSEGQIFSIKKNKLKILQKDIYGYLRVTLYRGTKGTKFYVHRLVAQVFIPNPENKPEVDHIDTNPLNNSVSNLRWATRYENRHNPVSEEKYNKVDHRTNLGRTGKLQPQSKLIRCVELDRLFWGSMEAERELGIDHRHIQDVLHGRARRKRAGGYHWEYVKEDTEKNI